MKNKILMTYLCYVNDENEKRRGNNFEKSINSLKLLEGQNCEIIAINNNCSKKYRDKINNNNIFKDVINLKKNFWDVSVIFLSAYLAKKNNFKYCCYFYDDFVVYDDDFIQSCIDFMEKNIDVGCIRIPKYEYENQDLYNSVITPKSKNPEAVRHYSNNHVNKKNLSWEGPYNVNHKTFYKNNWHYSSRPAVWNTEVLLSFFDGMKDIPVMQPFEKYSAIKFYHTGLKTGILDKGSMYTFLESERTNSKSGYGYGKTINIPELINAIGVK